MDTPKALRVFSSRNYRFFFTGQLISRIGTWTQRTAVIWVIYTMTQSVFWVGVTTFAEQIPSFLLSPSGGVIADRYNRFRILMFTQLTMALQAVLLTCVYYGSPHPVWIMLSLSVLLGIANAYDVPARQAMINDIVDRKEDLPGAIAMNSSLNNLSRLLGPAISGIVLAKYGATVCFASNAVSFIAVILCLNLMHFPDSEAHRKKQRAKADLQDGIRYMQSHPEIGKTLFLLAAICMFVATYNTLQPYYAREILHGNAVTYGYINAATGLGALVSTLVIASQRNSIKLKMMLLGNLLILGATLLLMSHTGHLWYYLPLCFLGGFGTMSVMPICNTIIQTVSAPEMRGRMVGFFAMAAFGSLPLGSLLAGWISGTIGVQHCIMGQGITALIIAALFFRFLRRPFLAERPE